MTTVRPIEHFTHHLCRLGCPEILAEFVAIRVYKSSNPTGPLPTSVADAVLSYVLWGATPEAEIPGFWESFYFAIRNEEQHRGRNLYA